MAKRRFKIEYTGSMFWIFFWGIFFFPIALILLLSSGRFSIGNKAYTFSYDGSTFWLCFWTLFLFPVAILLLFLNGVSVVEETD